MGERTMKITVVGAVLIIAGVVAALILLDGLSKQSGTNTEPQNPIGPDGGYPRDWSM
jgi:hypothetical protein